MADDSGPLCNSTKNHLELTLEQPTKYADDIEAGGTFPDTDEERFDDNEVVEEKGSDEEDDKKDKISSKIPPLYQVEPGCTPLSCYCAILAFIVMTLGIFWLLLISPPKNSIPVPRPDTVTEQQSENYDFADDKFSSSYDDELSSSTTARVTTMTTTTTESTTTSKVKGEPLKKALGLVIEDSGA